MERWECYKISRSNVIATTDDVQGDSAFSEVLKCKK